jgi:oligosaccharide repeat unit polymerase
MNNYEFLALLYRNIFLYIFIILSILLIYYLVFRKFFFTILDPLVLSIFLSAFASGVVVLLYIKSEISNFIFLQFILSQLLFLFGLFVFKPIVVEDIIKNKYKRLKKFTFKNELLFIEILFLVISLILIILQVYVYITRGIPLFKRSRLEVFADGSGFGIINRILNISIISTFYLVFHFLFFLKKIRIKIYVYFILIFLILTSILTGSKSSFLIIGYVFSCFIFFNMLGSQIKPLEYFRKIRKTSIIIIFAGIIVALFVLSVQRQSQNPIGPVASLLYRFVDTGSIYWYSYPNDVYKTINSTRPFIVLFGDLLGFLRIVPWQFQDINPGLVLFRYHHPEFSSIIMGPNMRHNVFGLVYFGFFGSLIFSFLIGILTSFCRNFLLKSLPGNFMIGILYTLFYINVITLETDPILAFTYINNIFIVFPIFIILSFAIYLLFINLFANEN